MKTTIKTLFQQGHNKTQIARMLNIDRKTVRKVLAESEETESERDRKSYPTQYDAYAEYIAAKLGKELSVKRIHQDLIEEYGIRASYSSLRDYVRKRRPEIQKAYMVLMATPGEEAQVDFGYIGALSVRGKKRKAWVFIMTLSCSRYMYCRIVTDQSVKTFIDCHIRAFRYFGGVTRTVKIDNLKAAILEADFYEPITQRTYAEFAAFYGFLPIPCRVYTPTDKGKIEANVKYVKDNCFKGRDFADIGEAAAFLDKWLLRIANARKHGTTQKVPVREFEEREKEFLQSLPTAEFVFSRSRKAVVTSQCHISYETNLYSVPYAYVGCKVDAIEVNNLLKIYFKGKEIALHVIPANAKGEHITDKNHYPSSKNIPYEEHLSNVLAKMTEIGDGGVEFFNRFYHNPDKPPHNRIVFGVLSLRKKYSDNIINSACKRACYYGNISYQAVKRICETGTDLLPLPEMSGTDGSALLHAGDNVRELSEYRELAGLGVIRHE